MSGGLGEFYERIKPHDADEQNNFLLRFATASSMFHKGNDRMTPEKQAIQEANPHACITSFCDGCVYAPPSSRDEMIKHFSMDIEAGTQMFWNQIAFFREDEGARFVVDIDSSDRILSVEEINKLGVVLQQTVRAYYTDRSRPVELVGSVCGPRRKKGKMSTAVHFVVHVKLNCLEDARQMLFAYEMRLLKDRDIDTKGLDIDSGIYKMAAQQVSLRMIYCHKREDCVICHNETVDRLSCDTCGRSGLLVSKFSYEPKLTVDDQGVVSSDAHWQKFHKDYLTMAKSHSIWPQPGEERDDYHKPDCDPKYDLDQRIAKNSKGKKRKSPTKSLAQANNQSFEQLEEFINQIYYDGKYPWREATVSDIRVKEKVATVYLTGSGSTNCLYVKGHHTGNRITFQLTRKGILTQYCFSTKRECCKSPPTRIRFTVPGKIADMVFGVKSPPGFFNAKRYKDKGTFDMHNFAKRVPVQGSHQHGGADDVHKQRLARIARMYNLKHDD